MKTIDYIEEPYFIYKQKICKREPYKVEWDGSRIIYEFRWSETEFIKLWDMYVYKNKEDLKNNL